jgi:hypothetical protein
MYRLFIFAVLMMAAGIIMALCMLILNIVVLMKLVVLNHGQLPSKVIVVWACRAYVAFLIIAVPLACVFDRNTTNTT